MMNKTQIMALSVSAILMTSCDDFSQKNLTNGPQKEVAKPFQLQAGANNEDLVNSGAFSKRKLVANAALNLATPAYADLKVKSDKFHTSVVKYCDVVSKASAWDSGVFDTLRVDLKGNWEELMSTFHTIEAFQFGPQSEGFPDTEMTKIFPYGSSWDCGALGEVVKAANDPDYRFMAEYAPYGLSNLNPLTHAKSVESYCPDSRVNNSIVEWRKKDRLVREKDICKYTVEVSKESNERITRVTNQWDVKQGYLAKKIIDDNYFGNIIATINKLSDGLFFVEKELKDERLAVPTGISNCLSTSCPYMSIHRVSGVSIDSVLANLKGFKMLFKGMTYNNGVDGFGFDDYLESVGKTFVRIQIEGAINDAIANFEKAKANGESIESLSAKIQDKKLCKESTTEQRHFEMCGLFQDVRRVSVLLKNEFLLALGELSAPRQVQGDMD
jgi:predicted lipoprotein